MQFEDPRTILEAAAAKPSRGVDAPALVKQGARLRRARLAAAVTGVTVVVVAASASFGMLADGGRDDAAPGPAAECDQGDDACRARAEFCELPLPPNASIFLRDDAPKEDVLELRDLLLRQRGIVQVEYHSKKDAYEEFVALNEGQSELWPTIHPDDLPATLRVTVSDDAALRRIQNLDSVLVDETRSSLDVRERLCQEAARPAPDPTAVPHLEPPVPAAGERAAVVKVLRAECRTRSIDRSISFRDATRWCRFVLLVDNQGSRSLSLNAGDQVLRTANGEAGPPAEDLMSGDFSTRLFTSPIPAGRRRTGQVIFLVPPDDIPAVLELHPRPGFAPASVLLEYDCARDLHDEPGGRCFLGLQSASVGLEQTWARTTVTLYHCGFEPVSFRGREWVVPDPPFDATNAPEGFAGEGLFKQRSARDALYYDDGGEVVHFEAIEDWDPPPCD